MMHLVIAETEIEPIPEDIRSHPEIEEYCESRGKTPEECILDTNKTPNAIISLEEGAVRGRPEILHICLLNALESDLYKNGKMSVWVHTRGGKCIEVGERFRIPRMYSRFLGLLEELFKSGRVPPEGPPSLIMKDMSLKDLIESLEPSKSFILSKEGKKIKSSTLVRKLSKQKNPLVMVGGFTDRDFSPQTMDLGDLVYRISENQLMSWSVLGAVVYGMS